MKVQKVNQLHLIVGSEETQIFVNGHHFPLNLDSDKQTAADFKKFVPGQIGLGTLTAVSGIVRFSNFRIKRFPWDIEPTKDNDERIKFFSYILKDEPTPSNLHAFRAFAYHNKNDHEKSILDLKQAIKANPKSAKNFLGIMAEDYYYLGKYKEAHSHFEQVLRNKNLPTMVLSMAAWFFATCPDAKYRNGKRAVELAKKAIKMVKSPQWHHLSRLACAHAEAGQFNEAIKHMQKAIAAAPENEKEEARKKLKLFQGKKPYHEEPIKKT